MIDWKPGVAYIASPYSHPDAEVRERRWRDVMEATAILVQEGNHVYSPIAHWHSIATIFKLPKGWGFWGAVDKEIIERCDRIWVYMMSGWDESEGIFEELKIARKAGLEIEGFRMLHGNLEFELSTEVLREWFDKILHDRTT